jgi:predicted alpha/beta superfamily hydrolase
MYIIKTTFIALCFSLAACTNAEDKTAPKSETPVFEDLPSATPIVIGESFKITSDITGESHEVNVWTPPEMGKDGKTYPVLYVIDGGLDQDFQHIAGLAQLTVINNRFETPIVVGIRTSHRYYQLTPKMTDERYLPWNGTTEKPEMGGADNFHRFITEEVRPFIEKKYPHNERRIVIGESLAGFYITREFLRYPDSFTDYIAISPSLWLDDQHLAKEAANLLEGHQDSQKNLYVTMADEGGTMQAGLDKVMRAIDARDFENLNMIYVDRRNSESHSTIYHGAALDALTQLFGIPVPDYGPSAWYLREGGQPEEDTK